MKTISTALLTLGISTSLFAITPEQQEELNGIFKEKADFILKSSASLENKQKMIQTLSQKKKEIEEKNDEEIEKFIQANKKKAQEEKKEYTIIEYDDGWKGWLFGSSGARASFFFGGNLGSAYIVYGTIGPKYNFSSGGSSLLRTRGFSLSLPIGFGAINTSGIKNDVDFVLPIALEANYMFSDGLGFGLSAGVRYSFSPQDRGTLHMMDIYAGIDIYYGLYLEAGYVFYSSQDVTIANRTISTDPLSGAITLNLGLRF